MRPSEPSRGISALFRKRACDVLGNRIIVLTPVNALLERIVLIGASGKLGSGLLDALAPFGPIVANRSAYDLADAGDMRALVARFRPTVVINTAAYHQVEQCEIHPDRALAINAVAVDALAATCALTGAAFVHVSTDYVFDGRANRPYREDDALNPINAYGVSKAAGEHLLRRHGERTMIVRTSGLYGAGRGRIPEDTFVERIFAQAARGEAIRVVNDVTFSPSSCVDVAVAIRAILERGAFGIYHVTNGGHCTWYEFACEAFRLARLDPARIEPVSYKSFDTYVSRPTFSALEPAAMTREGLPLPPSWQSALATYVARRAS